MKILIFLCVFALVKGQEMLDHCPSTEDLFANRARLPDSMLSAEAQMIRNGEEWNDNQRLVLTIPLTDAQGRSPLVQKIKLVANARIKMTYTSPEHPSYIPMPRGTWSHRSEYTIRGKPVAMTSLRLTLGRKFNRSDPKYRAKTLRVFGCDRHVIDTVQEAAAEQKEWEDIEW